jgi:feruloyl-CoA synthase
VRASLGAARRRLVALLSVEALLLAGFAAVASLPIAYGVLRAMTGGSSRVCRAILLAEPPSLDAGEMTDKGSINQRAVLGRRAAEVADLYSSDPSARVISIDKRP